MRFLVLVALAAGLTACSSAGSSSTTTTSPYFHPKAYAWSRTHLADVDAIIGESQLIWGEMQSCNLQPDQFTCPPSTPPSSDPANWTMRLPEDCGKMTTATSTAQSDGPIPNAQAQSWWDQTLIDFNQACSSISTAAAAEQTDIQNGVSGYDPATMVPGGQAASELEAAVQLNNRVGAYITAKR